MTLEELRVIATLHGLSCSFKRLDWFSTEFVSRCKLADGLHGDEQVLRLRPPAENSDLGQYDTLVIIMYRGRATIIDSVDYYPNLYQSQFEFLRNLPVRIYKI